MNQNGYSSILPFLHYSYDKLLDLQWSTNSLIAGTVTQAWWILMNPTLCKMSFRWRDKVIHDLLSCCAFLSEFTGKLIKISTNFLYQAQAKNLSWKLDNYELKCILQLVISIPLRQPKLYWKPINCLQIPQSVTS